MNDSPAPHPARFDAHNLRNRVITGVVAATGVVGLLLWSAWGLLILCIATSYAAMMEFFSLVEGGLRNPLAWGTFILVGLLWAYGGALAGQWELRPEVVRTAAWLILLFLPALAILQLYRPKDRAGFLGLGYSLLAVGYLFLPFFLLYLFGTGGPTYEGTRPLGILLLIWATDVGAYFAGKFWGRHKLFPSISPGKTWEGLVGGLLLALLTGWLLVAAITAPPGTALHLGDVHHLVWAGAGMLAAAAGTYGDLVESLFKRNLHVKDSGSLLPGHGGVLDRFDGFLLAMPLLFLYFRTVVSG